MRAQHSKRMCESQAQQLAMATMVKKQEDFMQSLLDDDSSESGEDDTTDDDNSTSSDSSSSEHQPTREAALVDVDVAHAVGVPRTDSRVKTILPECILCREVRIQ